MSKVYIFVGIVCELFLVIWILGRGADSVLEYAIMAVGVLVVNVILYKIYKMLKG